MAIGMDMGRILTVFNNMKNVNMSGTPAAKDEPVEEEIEQIKPVSECTNCNGLGAIDLGWGETVPCKTCEARGTIEEAIQQPLPIFKPGDTVEFCGEYATVLADYGSEIKVDLGHGQGTCKWYKMFQGEPVTLVKRNIKEYSDGKNSGNIGDSGAEDEGPSSKYGAGQMWQRDEMDIPPIHSFKDEFAKEKFSDQAVNDHDLTVDDQLEQNGLEESLNPTVWFIEPLEKWPEEEEEITPFGTWLHKPSADEIAHIENAYEGEELGEVQSIPWSEYQKRGSIWSVDSLRERISNLQEGLEEAKDYKCSCGHARFEHDADGYCDVCSTCHGFDAAKLDEAIEPCKICGKDTTAPVEEETTPKKFYSCNDCYDDSRGMDCSNCDGKGFLEMGWGESVDCGHCEGTGKQPCRCGNGNIHDDENALGESNASNLWRRDEMDIPDEKEFSADIAGEKSSDQAINDHDLTVDDQLEQEGLEESYGDPNIMDEGKISEDFNDDMSNFVQAWVKDSTNNREIPQRRQKMEHEIIWCQKAVEQLEELLQRKPSKIKEIKTLQRQIREKELKLAFDPYYGGEVKELPAERQMMDRLEEAKEHCISCGADLVAPGVKFCDDCFKTSYDKAKERVSQQHMKRRASDKVEESRVKSVAELIREQINNLEKVGN